MYVCVVLWLSVLDKGALQVQLAHYLVGCHSWDTGTGVTAVEDANSWPS